MLARFGHVCYWICTTAAIIMFVLVLLNFLGAFGVLPLDGPRGSAIEVGIVLFVLAVLTYGIGRIIRYVLTSK